MDNDTKTKTQKYMSKLFDNRKFTDKYGGSLVITITIILWFTGQLLYQYIMSKTVPINKNWEQEKCKPHIIPLAGIIRQNKGGLGVNDYTNKNFQECTNKVLAGVVKVPLQPVMQLSNMLDINFTGITGNLDFVRVFFNNIKNKLLQIINYVYQKIIALILPIINLFIKVKDIFQRLLTTVTSLIYSVMISVYMSIHSIKGVTLSLGLSIGALVLIIAITWAIAIFLGPFGIPSAIAASMMTIIMLALMTFLSVILHFINDFIYQAVEILECFDENTIIKTKKGDVKIKNLKKGTILKDGSKVTATFITLKGNQKMYDLDGIYVSESHKVLHDDLGWIYVKDHPEAKVIQNYNKEILYCFSTDSKRIKIKNHKFLDWDDLETIDIIKLKNLNYLNNNSSLKDIHSKLE